MRLLIVDDDPTFSGSLAGILGYQQEVASVETAASYDAALRAAARTSPDVALIDFHLGEGSKDGIELGVALRQVSPTTYTVLVTGDESPKIADRGVSSGFDGVLWKNFSLRGLLGAFDGWRARRRYLPAEVAVAVALNRPALEPSPESDLTRVELEVLVALARGATAKEIAKARCRSVDTIDSHLQAIYRKLGVTCREEAIKEARRRGLV